MLKKNDLLCHSLMLLNVAYYAIDTPLLFHVMLSIKIKIMIKYYSNNVLKVTYYAQNNARIIWKSLVPDDYVLTLYTPVHVCTYVCAECYILRASTIVISKHTDKQTHRQKNIVSQHW